MRHTDQVVQFSTRKELALLIYLAAGDEATWAAAVRDALSFREQARHLMVERLHGLDRRAMLPAQEIEDL